MSGEIGTMTGMARLPIEALDRVLRDSWGPVAAARLYSWLGMFSDDGFRVLERDVASVRFRLEWDAEALKDLIAHGVESCLASGQDLADLVDRRLFGARPRYSYAELVPGEGARSR